MAEGSTLDGFTVTNVGSYDEATWKKHFDSKGEEHAFVAGLIAALFAVKQVSKFAGVHFLMRRYFPRDVMHSTLLMSTGLTFGTISALFGLTNHVIDQVQYTILVTTVIGSAIVPTMIAQRFGDADHHLERYAALS